MTDPSDLRYIKAAVRIPTPGQAARWEDTTVGWLPSEGLFCSTHGKSRCVHIRADLAQLTTKENPR